MSISAYAGLPGSGKSHEIVHNVILPALKSGRTVFTNIPMHNDLCMADFGNQVIPFSIQDIKADPTWWTTVFIAGSLWVCDELSSLWPAGMTQKMFRIEDNKFLTEHRHQVGENGLSTEIYLISQDLAQIASAVRALVETTVRMVNLGTVGMEKSFRVDIYSGPVVGSNPPTSRIIRSINMNKYNPDVYKYYISHTQSMTGVAGIETKVDQRGNFLKSGSLKASFVFLAVAIVGCWWAISNFKSDVKTKAHSGSSSSVFSSSLPAVGASVVTSVAKSSVASRTRNDPENPPFLSKAKKFLVAWSVSSRDHVTDYFTIQFDAYSVTLSNAELGRMGYRITRVTNCLYKVVGFDYSGYVSCPTPPERSSFAERVLADSPISTK